MLLLAHHTRPPKCCYTYQNQHHMAQPASQDAVHTPNQHWRYVVVHQALEQLKCCC
jgi:hypothetical protein